jgi:hypothetical protein
MSQRFYNSVKRGWTRQFKDHGTTFTYKTVPINCCLVVTDEIIDMAEQFADAGTRQVTTLKSYFVNASTYPKQGESVLFNSVSRKIKKITGADDPVSPILIITLEAANAP